ncbi:STAS-like domain-containing protein [Pseudomonas syringae]|nr:STAS-like domain-containing protein [Pseudomonas syringae]
MNSVHEVNIKVGDFSKTPYGRYERDGKFNAALFRDSKLAPAFKDPEVTKVNVHLDTVEEGYEYGSSFLEEAFGGLVRKCGFTADEVRSKLNVVTIHKDYVLEINEYLEAL